MWLIRAGETGPSSPFGALAADSGRPAEGEATFYDTSRPGLVKVVSRVDNTIKQPSGGILSTPSDMVRLGHEMIEPTLFDEATPVIGQALLAVGVAPGVADGVGEQCGDEVAADQNQDEGRNTPVA